MSITAISNQIITTEEFLNEIHGPDTDIYFNIGNKTWKKPKKYNDELRTNLKWLNNEKKQDICFIVNSGGKRNSQINKINALFIDWDCGKDLHGNYFSLDIVTKNKSLFFPTINNFRLSPSFIVETRNGYHAYWLLHPGTNNKQFIDAQKRLSHLFNSDKGVHNPARVMRLPNYYWIKSGSNCDPYYVNIISYNPVRYHFDIISKSILSSPTITYSVSCNNSDLSSVSASASSDVPAQIVSQSSEEAYDNCSLDTPSFSPVGEKKEEEESPDYSITSSRGFRPYNNNRTKGTSAIIVGPKTPSPKKKLIMSTVNEAVGYLKTVNLFEYLELTNGNMSENELVICCPFHNDNIPSAKIYNNDGHYMLTCFSDKCSFKTGTIIDVVKHERQCDESEAISFLLKHYNIEIDKSWIENKKDMLTENISTIKKLSENKDKYPDLYRCISRIRDDLITKLRFAREKIIAQTENGDVLFFCSLREFDRRSKFMITKRRGHNGQNLKVDRYCLLGLMKKLGKEEIPKTMWKRAEEEQKFDYHIQFYSIPEYTDDILSKADEIAKTLKQFNASLNSISRSLVKTVFGEERARELYPQVETDEFSKSNIQFETEVEQVLMPDIQSKGYGRVSEIIEKMTEKHDWASVTNRRVRRCLPGLMLKHNLVMVSVNKELKEKYGIGGLGYPRIIVGKSEMEGSEGSPECSQTSQDGPGLKKSYGPDVWVSF